MRPTGAAGTVELLDTGLRQYQPDSKNPLAVGLSGGAETLRAGTSHRSPPDVSGRLGSQPGYRIPQGVTHSENCEMRSTFEAWPFT
jgi:hypothetical protein